MKSYMLVLVLSSTVQKIVVLYNRTLHLTDCNLKVHANNPVLFLTVLCPQLCILLPYTDCDCTAVTWSARDLNSVHSLYITFNQKHGFHDPGTASLPAENVTSSWTWHHDLKVVCKILNNSKCYTMTKLCTLFAVMHKCFCLFTYK